MGDLMDMRWLVRDMNNRAVDEVRIQHIFTPGLPEEIRTEKIRRQKFAKAERHIPFYFILDILYIWASFLSVGVSIIYFIMFPMLLGWTPSIQSFTAKEKTHVGGKTLRHDMLEKHGYTTHDWCSYYLFTSIILFVVSWTSFIGAGVLGKRWIYIISLVTHGLIILTEAFAVYNAFTYLPTSCDTTIFRSRMTELFRWYGILTPHSDNHGHEAMDKIHELQAALACCGIDSYKDYEKIFATKGDPAFDPSWYPSTIYVHESYIIKDRDYYMESGREVRRMPHSCCNPFWRQNVYCADDIFTMERVTNQSVAPNRLNRRGCVAVVKETCERLKYLLTYGMLAVLVLRLILWIVMLITTAITLRSMSLVMTTLFSVTRGNVRFIYDYRKTHPEEDPYKKAIGDFRRGVIPEGWDEFAQKRIEGRKKAHLITEQFRIGDLMSHADVENRGYLENIRNSKKQEPGEAIYFGAEPPPDMTEQEYLAIRGQEKVKRQSNEMFSRLAQIGVEDRRIEAELKKSIVKAAEQEKNRREAAGATRLRLLQRVLPKKVDKSESSLEGKQLQNVQGQWRFPIDPIRKEQENGIGDSRNWKSKEMPQRMKSDMSTAKTVGVIKTAKRITQKAAKKAGLKKSGPSMKEAEVPENQERKVPKSKTKTVGPTPELRRKVKDKIEEIFQEVEKMDQDLLRKRRPAKAKAPTAVSSPTSGSDEEPERIRRKKVLKSELTLVIPVKFKTRESRSSSEERIQPISNPEPTPKPRSRKSKYKGFDHPKFAIQEESVTSGKKKKGGSRKRTPDSEPSVKSVGRRVKRKEAMDDAPPTPSPRSPRK